MRSLKLIIRLAAAGDILDIAEFLERNASPRVADRFLDAVRSAFTMVGKWPALGSSYHSPAFPYGMFRRWPVPGFQAYLMFYIQNKDSVEIIRVVHGARDFDVLLGVGDAPNQY